MLWRKNELGWRAYKWRRGYMFTVPGLPLRFRVARYIPVTVSVFAALVTWLQVGPGDRLDVTLLTIPLCLFLGFWFFRPAVLYINTQLRLILGGGYFPRFPFDRAQMCIRRSEDEGYYCLHVEDLASGWRTMFWVAPTEAEISVIANELRKHGLMVGHGIR